jgi:MFS family permease
MAPALFILLSVMVENGVILKSINGDVAYVPGLVMLFLLIASAVGIFIFSGMNFERYKFMEEGVRLPLGVAADLKKRHEAFNPTFYLCVIVGVCLCIISPVSLFLSSMISDEAIEYGVVALLIIIAFAVFLFISSGTVRDSYEKLLQIGDSAPKQKKEDKVISAVAACVWPLAVAVFLFCGFLYNLWHIAWVVFPITGILFGMFSAVYSIVTDKEAK